MTLNHLVWGGSIMNNRSGGEAIEIWSCSLSIESADADWSADNIVAIKDHVVAFHSGADANIDARVRLEFVKCNPLDPVTGLQLSDPTIAIDGLDVRGVVTGVESRYPLLTTAYRVSLDDGTRNRRHRGGFFVPLPQVNVGMNGRITGPFVSQLADGAEDFVGGLLGILGGLPVIWSRASGTLTPITRVRVGDILDYQGRRRNELVEEYQVRLLP